MQPVSPLQKTERRHIISLLKMNSCRKIYIDSETGKRRWYIFDYLKTIVKPKFQKNPCIALNKFRDTNSFISQCESVRIAYRNRAAHPEIITRDEAENCYYQIVGKAEAYLHKTKVQGLILLLYNNYLKD